MSYGIGRRQEFAMAAMRELLPRLAPPIEMALSLEQVAKVSVAAADALIAELDKEQDE